MAISRFSFRIFWLYSPMPRWLFAGVIMAMYLRLGVSGRPSISTNVTLAQDRLVAGVCLLILYFTISRLHRDDAAAASCCSGWCRRLDRVGVVGSRVLLFATTLGCRGVFW